MKETFIVDFIACLPITNLIKNSTSDKIRLYRLLKLLRLPRLAQLLDVEKVKSIVKDYYKRQLIENIKKDVANLDEYSYPILRAILIVQFYKIM